MPDKDATHPRRRVYRADQAMEKKRQRIREEIGKPNDFISPDWLRSMGFRPSQKYSRGLTADGLSMLLPGGSVLTWTTSYLEYDSTKPFAARWVRKEGVFLVTHSGKTEKFGILSRHDVLFILQAAFKEQDT